MKKILLFLSRGLCWFLMGLLFFVVLFSGLAFIENSFSLDVPFVEEVSHMGHDMWGVIPPFTDSIVAFPLNVKMLALWAVFGFYAYYFWTLKEFLEHQITGDVITATSIKVLRRFIILNLVPVIIGAVVMIAEMISKGSMKFTEETSYIIIHGIIAIFIYLNYNVARKAMVIKEENDLTI